MHVDCVPSMKAGIGPKPSQESGWLRKLQRASLQGTNEAKSSSSRGWLKIPHAEMMVKSHRGIGGDGIDYE